MMRRRSIALFLITIVLLASPCAQAAHAGITLRMTDAELEACVVYPTLNGNLFFAEGYEGPWGLANREGMILIAPEWDDCSVSYRDLDCVQIDGLWYPIDAQSRLIGEGSLWADTFVDENGLMRIQRDGLWGFADIHGTEVIPLRYEYASRFSEGLAEVALDGQRGYIDPQGNMVIEPQCDLAGSFAGGLAWIWARNPEGKRAYGYIDATGASVIPPTWSSAWDFVGDYALVKDWNGLWGAIDRSGAVVIPPQFSDVTTWISRGDDTPCYVVNRDGLIGFLGTDMRWATEPVYPYRTDSQDMLPRMILGACVLRTQRNDSYLIGDDGTQLLAAADLPGVHSFIEGERGADGRAYVVAYGKAADGQVALIDQDGNFVVEFGKYDEIEWLDNRFLAVRAAGVYSGWGMIDLSGREVIPARYGRVQLVDTDSSTADSPVVLVAEFILADEEEAGNEHDCDTGELLEPAPEVALRMAQETRTRYTWYEDGPIGGAWGVFDTQGNQLLEFVGECEPNARIYATPIDGALGVVTTEVAGTWRVWELR